MTEPAPSHGCALSATAADSTSCRGCRCAGFCPPCPRPTQPTPFLPRHVRACSYLASKAEESVVAAKVLVATMKRLRPAWSYEVPQLLDAEMVGARGGGLPCV